MGVILLADFFSCSSFSCGFGIGYGSRWRTGEYVDPGA